MRFFPEEFDRSESPRVMTATAGIMLFHPSVDIVGDPRVQRLVGTLNDVDKPSHGNGSIL
jgi:hypothetical protein